MRSKTPLRLANKVAVVTGAGRGLGRAYALALAHAGAAVVVNDLGVDNSSSSPSDCAGSLVREIRDGGGRAIAILESVASSGGAQRLIQETLAAFGHIDILVNNAGILRRQPIVETSDSEFDETIAVHLRGTFLCTREAMRAMSGAGNGGRIINTTSGRAYYEPSAGTASYAAAKGAIMSLTGVTAAEGAEFRITCNAVSPLARTAMSADYFSEDHDPRLDPSCVAPLVVFLSSDAAAHITGRIFRIARGEISLVHNQMDEPIRPSGDGWTADEIGARIDTILR